MKFEGPDVSQSPADEVRSLRPHADQHLKNFNDDKLLQDLKDELYEFKDTNANDKFFW